jgi:putative ABC transport system substrate-binding protein
MIPSLRRVLFPYDPTDVNSRSGAVVYGETSRQLGIVLVERAVRTGEEARAALARVRRGDIDGIVPPSSVSLNIPGLVLEASAQRVIPTMFSAAFWVEQGALAGYGSDFYESGRQAARLMEKVLKGEKPASIPVETNPRIELVINLRVASALKIQISPIALQRASRVIE